MTTRRAFLAGAGALVVSFSLAPPVRAQRGGPELPGSLRKAPLLDSRIRVEADNRITVFTGKAELGQGIRTALVQVAAEELDVAFERVRLVTADTARTPDEGFTAGSNSMKDSGTAIRNAAAQVRELLVARAAQRMGVAAESLRVEDGTVIGAGSARLTYGELVAGEQLHVEAAPASRFKDPKSYRIVSKPWPRVDIPAKVTGGEAYVHDIKLPGMLHARVVRPPSYGATLASVDTRAAEALRGVVKVIRDGSFLAVVADREWAAVKAMRLLVAAARWDERKTLPDMNRLPAVLAALPSQDIIVAEKGAAAAGAGRTLEATYSRHYQAHASIGPSCALALAKDGFLTVWSHTQGVYPDREAIAEMLAMPPEKVRVIHAEGSGCYGHNGADDAAADAALIAVALPGRAVRVQWMREHEHLWEPFGPAMVSKARATLDAGGGVSGWSYEVWSNTHSTRPGGAAALLAAQHGGKAFKPKPAQPSRSPDGMGERNAVPLYVFPDLKVVHHFIAEMPVRVSALRALGAYHNVFALESFMDELALAAAADPVEFRLRHLEDPRARDVIRLAAQKFGWKAGARAPASHGYGFGFARYKNSAAYCAIAAEVKVDRARDRIRLVRAVAAVDSGQVVNPDGLRNQVEGAIIQSTSWTLHEKVSFDDTRIRSSDWSTYPILRFDGVPRSVEVHLVDRPGEPYLGSGEAGQGPTAAALGNAVAHASGVRLRDIPLTFRTGAR
ncbi:MAG TPA: molybdopterin cofactor-binding domain-containing protein [Usitatibacter sp.]|nr:molybdopterin cofactor-binding domain-containing protein [Usitatibacter sp.]